MKKIAWVPDNLVLASASYDNTIKFWAQKDDDWECIDTIAGHSSTVWCIDFTKDGKFLASVSDDMKTKIWRKNEEFEDKDFYNHISTLEGYHDRPIYSCSWNFDGTLLATVRFVLVKCMNMFRLEVMIRFVCLVKLNLIMETWFHLLVYMRKK